MVELALLTYSPIPLRRSRRTLLVTPSSFARALTRTLDTFLLSRSVPGGRTVVTAGGCSSLSTHRVLISVKPAFGCFIGLVLRRTAVLLVAPDPLPDGAGIRWRAAAQRTSEGPTTHGEVEARGIRVQPSAAPRTTALGVRQEDGGAVRSGPEDHSQECRPAIRPTTPDARSHRLGGPGSRPVGPHESTAYAGSGASPASTEAGRAPSVSERMSMRQPVSLAANRAFCPSRPIARDSW